MDSLRSLRGPGLQRRRWDSWQEREEGAEMMHLEGEKPGKDLDKQQAGSTPRHIQAHRWKLKTKRKSWTQLEKEDQEKRRQQTADSSEARGQQAGGWPIPSAKTGTQILSNTNSVSTRYRNQGENSRFRSDLLRLYQNRELSTSTQWVWKGGRG